jgi:hypothetical protein
MEGQPRADRASKSVRSFARTSRQVCTLVRRAHPAPGLARRRPVLTRGDLDWLTRTTPIFNAIIDQSGRAL